MSKLIENIRQKPDHHKNRIVWTIIGITAGILLILWAIIGIPQREGKSTDVIDEFNTNLDESKDTLPKLFDNTK